MFGNFQKKIKKKSQENGPLEKKEKTKVSNWIVMSFQPHRVTSGQSNSGHKQMHISKLFSCIHKAFVKSVHKTSAWNAFVLCHFHPVTQCKYHNIWMSIFRVY